LYWGRGGLFVRYQNRYAILDFRSKRIKQMAQAKTEKDVEVKIKTSQGPWETVFPKTEKVEGVIKAVIEHFGFAPDQNPELSIEGHDKPLKPERTLESYEIKDGTVLKFTEHGSGA
jgi:hypothetical protein